MTPAIIVGNALLKGSVTASDEWRMHGEARRRELLAKDELEGGTFFDIRGKISIHRYFQIGDRVLSQFRSMYERRSKLEDVYVVGYRLIAFYTEALPEHKDYRSIDPRISALREKTIDDLDWIRKRLDVVALRIDEQQLNLHIQRPQEQVTNASMASSRRQEMALVNYNDCVIKMAREEDGGRASTVEEEQQWESFTGWSADFASIDDEEEEEDHEGFSFLPKNDSAMPFLEQPDRNHHPLALTTGARFPLHLDPAPDADDPADVLDLESEGDDDDDDDTTDNECDGGTDWDSLSNVDSDERAVRFEFAVQEEAYNCSILKIIASEEVHYEDDSDAVDSWAQDNESVNDDDDDSFAEHMSYLAADFSREEDENTLGNIVNRFEKEASPSTTQNAVNSIVADSARASSRDETENVDPAACISSSKDTLSMTICSYPSFDEPPEEETANCQAATSFEVPPPQDDGKPQAGTSSPQDVMNFDAHFRLSPIKTDPGTAAANYSDEEIAPIYLPGLRI